MLFPGQQTCLFDTQFQDIALTRREIRGPAMTIRRTMQSETLSSLTEDACWGLYSPGVGIKGGPPRIP
jgi:hypothetical protein